VTPKPPWVIPTRIRVSRHNLIIKPNLIATQRGIRHTVLGHVEPRGLDMLRMLPPAMRAPHSIIASTQVLGYTISHLISCGPRREASRHDAIILFLASVSQRKFQRCQAWLTSIQKYGPPILSLHQHLRIASNNTNRFSQTITEFQPIRRSSMSLFAASLLVTASCAPISASPQGDALITLLYP